MTAGRKKTVNLWPRRIITGLGLLAVLALLVGGILALVGVVRGALSEDGPDAAAGAQSGQPDQSDTQSGPGLNDPTSGGEGGLSAVVIAACTADDLSVAPDVPSAVPAGEGLSVAFTLTSVSAKDCSLSTGRLALRVVSGDQVVSDPSTCVAADQSGADGTELLFATGFHWSGTLTWDGRAHQGCDGVDTDGDGQADVAGAGTYRAQILVDGRRVGDERVFEVQ